MIGQTLGAFRIEEELGAGGMGTVYLATAVAAAPPFGPGESAALKVIHPHLVEMPDLLRRFLREGEAGTKVVHENVVHTSSVETAEVDGAELHYLVMEYVKGKSLRALLAELGRIPESLLREIARQIAHGLAAIHTAGVIHRDLKPDNVLITEDQRVRIMDLGVARLMDETLRLTAEGRFTGSLQYAAPEQFENDIIGPETDLYALGVLLYELASGENPFHRDDVGGIVNAQLRYRPPRLNDREPDLSLFLSELVAQLMEKRAKNRFEAAKDLVDIFAEGERSDWWAARDLETVTDLTRLPQVPVRKETPIHGRAAELNSLRAAWTAAKEADGRVVLIEGEAGIGKTRLVYEFLSGLATEDAHVLYGSYPPTGGMGGLSDSILVHFGKLDLADRMAPYLPSMPALVPAFAAMSAHGAPPAGSVPLDGDGMHAVLCQLLKGLADERPLVWVVDDLHFAPEESRKLVLSMARAVEGQPALLLLTARPGFQVDGTGDLHRLGWFERIELPRLGARQVIELLNDAFRSEALVDRLGAKIAYKSDGVPFFVFEMIRNLREGQLIQEMADGSFVETRVIEEIEVPSAVRDLIDSRLRGLADEDRELLDVAAVMGFEFDPHQVAAVCEMRFIRALQKLAVIERRSGIVRSGPDRYRFDHHQIQEVLYQNLPPALRVEYHAALAEALSTDGEGAKGETAYRLAFHFLRGHRPRRAASHLDAALDHLSASYRSDAALDLLDRALDRDSPIERSARVEYLLRRSELLQLTGRTAQERETLDEAVVLATGEDDPVLRGRVFARLGRHLVSTSDPATAVDRIREALELACSAGDAELMATTHGLLGNSLYMLGKWDEARTEFEEQLQTAKAAEDLRGEARAMGSLGILASVQGRYEESEEHYERARAAMRVVGDKRGELTAVGNLATLYTRTGRYADAQKLYEKVLSIARSIGYRRGEAIALGNLGIVLNHNGEQAEALKRGERMLAISIEIGDTEGEANARHNLATGLLGLGDVEGAAEHCRIALSRCTKAGAKRMAGYVVHCKGSVASVRGDYAEAIRRFEEAFQRFGEIQDPAGAAVALLSLGRVLHETGETEGAAARLTEALERGRELEIAHVVCVATARLALLPGGSKEEGLAALEEHGPRLGTTERMETVWLLWQATGIDALLQEARDLLRRVRERAPEGYAESLLDTVGWYREILNARSSS